MPIRLSVFGPFTILRQFRIHQRRIIRWKLPVKKAVVFPGYLKSLISTLIKNIYSVLVGKVSVDHYITGATDGNKVDSTVTALKPD
jgi:hypothetical protein